MQLFDNKYFHFVGFLGASVASVKHLFLLKVILTLVEFMTKLEKNCRLVLHHWLHSVEAQVKTRHIEHSIVCFVATYLESFKAVLFFKWEFLMT